MNIDDTLKILAGATALAAGSIGVYVSQLQIRKTKIETRKLELELATIADKHNSRGEVDYLNRFDALYNRKLTASFCVLMDFIQVITYVVLTQLAASFSEIAFMHLFTVVVAVFMLLPVCREARQLSYVLRRLSTRSRISPVPTDSATIPSRATDSSPIA